MAIMQRVCLRVSEAIGRMYAIMLFHALGTACLLLLCVVQPVQLLVPLYILRGALMNARQPIITAVTMDLVTTEMRGRWASIQSIGGFSWSGSAFVGGWIAASYGYRFSFFVTGLIYSASFLLYLPILWVMPKELSAAAGHAGPSFVKNARPSSSFSMALSEASVPLLEDQVVGIEDADQQRTARSRMTVPL